MHDLRPLSGLRVLDLSQGIAGPHCGGLFAEYGARVVKIEPPQGDWMRPLGPGFGDCSAAFIYYNRGKQSLALNLKATGAIDIVLDIAAKSDVLIENNRPGVSDRLGFGFEAVKARQPRIIYVSVSGFGHTGPDAQKPLSDTVAQAHSGMMMINRGRADVPIEDRHNHHRCHHRALCLPGGDHGALGQSRRRAQAQAISTSRWRRRQRRSRGRRSSSTASSAAMPIKLNPPAGSYQHIRRLARDHAGARGRLGRDLQGDQP